MLLSQRSLEEIHRYCTSNRPLLERAKSAGCFCCGATFAPGEIRDWIPPSDAGPARADTARCPKCGVDSVLPSTAPVMLTPRMVEALREYWFKHAH